MIIITGYSRAGKTTFLSFLEEKGYKIISTSKMVHEIATSFAQINGVNIDSTDKDSFVDMGVRMPMREYLVNVAENVLVKTLTRKICSLYIDSKIDEHAGSDIAIEIFNQVEYDGTKLSLMDKQIVFITRKEELKGIDLRSIISPDIIYENNGTILDMKKFIEKNF